MALQRLANADATGRAGLLVDEYTEDWSTLWWVRVDGSAQVLTADSSERWRTARRRGRPGQAGVALGALTRKYPQYVSQPPDWTCHRVTCDAMTGGRRSLRSAQLNESPQAQELPALGLSMVKPCFSMVSAKSIDAPPR